MENGKAEIIDQNAGDQAGSKLPEGIVAAAKKRGRPPGSKNSTEINTGTTQKSKPETSQDVNSLESAKFIGTGAVALLELVESMIHSNCANKIEKKIPEKLLEFKQMAQELGLQKQDKELISNCVEKIAIRHELLIRYAPEVVLAIALGQYSLRQVSLIKFVENITKKKVEVSVTQTVAA